METSISIVGEEVWLVMVSTEPAEEEPGNPSLQAISSTPGPKVQRKDCAKLSPMSGAEP